MGIKLMVELMDYAPDVTASEWRALMILAEDANDGTRLTWSAPTSEKIMNRARMTAEAWANLRGTLVRKKLLDVAEPGRRGRAAKYRFPFYGSRPEVEVPGGSDLGHESDDETGLGHQIHEESRPKGHQTDEESAPTPHVTDDETAEYVMDSMPPTPPRSSDGSPPLPPPPVEEEGNGASPESEAARFVAALPFDAQHVAAGRVRELTTLVDDLLALGATTTDLGDELARDLHGVYNPIGVWRHRLAVRRTLLQVRQATPARRPRPPQPPCSAGGCSSCAHDQCNTQGFLIDRDTGVRCPCWFVPEARF